MDDKNITAGAAIHSGDGGYGIGTRENYEEFVKTRNKSLNLKQEEQQGEPVARLKGIDEYGPMLNWYKHWIEFPVGTKFHTTPQQRKPLTDEQMRDCLDAADQMYCEKDGDKELFKARAIEAAHNIKE